MPNSHQEDSENPQPGHSQVCALHKATFDTLASEYVKRFPALERRELFLLGPLTLYLRRAFPERERRVLDVGCGVGGSCGILSNDGFKTFGIDLAPRMIAEARLISPSTTFIEGDFLELDLGALSFHGICAKAVLHLFPKEDAAAFLRKCRALLLPGGAIYIAVAAGQDARGTIERKFDYPGQPKRYVQRWSLQSLLQHLADNNLEPVYWGEQSVDGRSWIDCWAVKA